MKKSTLIKLLLLGVLLAAQSGSATEAAAIANGHDYKAAKSDFEAALAGDRLADALAAADKLLASAAKPGKGEWRNEAQSYNYLVKALANRKIFARKECIALYERGIEQLEGYAKAALMVQYGLYLDTWALAGPEIVDQKFAEALAVPELTPAHKISLCQSAASHNGWSQRDKFGTRALGFAADDIALQGRIWRWYLGGNIRAMELDELCRRYDEALAKAELKEQLYGTHSIFGDYIRELIRRKEFEIALERFEQVPDDLKDTERRALLSLKGELYRRSAERYYDTPDPARLTLALEQYTTLLTELPTNQPQNTISCRLAIAELNHLLQRPQVAAEVASAALALVPQRETRESHHLAYLLALLAYEAEEYVKALSILEEAHTLICEKPGHMPRRRDIVELLVRSACAVGDFEKARAHGPTLLELVARHEKERYKIYLDGLQGR